MSVFDLVKDLLVLPALAPLSPPLAQAQSEAGVRPLAPLAPLAGARGILLQIGEPKANIMSGKALAGNNGPVLSFPSWCRSDCERLDIIDGLGPGCVRSLADGPWQEEWRWLDIMLTCPKRLH